MARDIIIRGARQHNLKNIDLVIPQNTLTILTGVSGSGKSTLAFDTLFAEGQRRFVESQSTYVRQFLQRLDKPDVDAIEGLCPTLAVQSRNTARTARSTVGTVTEIYDYLRLIYAKIGQVHCVECGKPVKALGIDEIAKSALEEFEGKKTYILAPHGVSEKLGPGVLRDIVRANGYSYIMAHDGAQPIDLETAGDSELAAVITKARERRTKNGASEEAAIYIVVDRIIVAKAKRARLTDSLETALKQGNGFCVLRAEDGQTEKEYSERPVCVHCGIAVAPPTPHLLSFNNPLGACPECSGFGDRYEIDMDAVIPDQSKTLREGAIACWQGKTISRYVRKMFAKGEEKLGVRIDVPYRDLSDEEKSRIMTGWGELYGLDEFFEEMGRKSYKASNRYFLRRFRALRQCSDCGGTRLNKLARSVKIDGKDIAELGALPLSELLAFAEKLQKKHAKNEVMKIPLREILSRTKYLVEIGLGYLTLWRMSRTLSGGEMQRIHLAAALGSRLTGTLTILDEPTVGLHPRDTDRLVRVLKDIRDTGNTVLVVEHDMQVMREADRIIDMGPGPGERGGEVVYSGTLKDFIKKSDSLTAQYLRGEKKVGARAAAKPAKEWLTVQGAAEHNLKNIDVVFPVNRITSVTGVSGSGKSTLVCDVLYPYIARRVSDADMRAGKCAGVDNWQAFKNIELLGQDPIGRTPRANPATYLDIMTPIRALFASTPEAKMKKVSPGLFSFNSPAGRCESCEGTGLIQIEMQFLADIYVQCEACGGTRYRPEALKMLYRDKNIGEVLAMTASEAMAFFRENNAIVNKLTALEDVALGYVRLGQPLSTLSAGEAQRLKIAAELGAGAKGHTLFLFDEPTMGLHPHEVDRLLMCLDRLVKKGHTVIVIEHNLEVIANSDYVVDLGPDGGASGGEVVAACAPNELLKNKTSYTAEFLRKNLS